MARVLRTFSFKKAPDWDKWLDGQIWELTRGKNGDFQMQLNSMQTKCHSEAAKRKKWVETSVVGTKFVVVRAHNGARPKNKTRKARKVTVKKVLSPRKAVAKKAVAKK